MLEQIKSPSDLKKLNIKQLPALCEEIRAFLIESVSNTGGHLASNLGVVELTVAIHYVFDDADKIVWDVGHQSYVHKILTGRADRFATLRQSYGLSGFCDPSESNSDAFVSGHASTAISQALGLATARDLRGEDYDVVAVVGDGALTGGLSYEALNNVKNTRMLIIVNDNGMSIAGNVGAISRNVSKMRVGAYDKRKARLKKFLLKVPLLGKPTYKFLRWWKGRVKRMLLRSNYFDVFDLKYAGIVDGHNIKELVAFLSKIKKNVNKPTVLHVSTKKGKGYAPAEENQEAYHVISTQIDSAVQSSEVVGKALVNLAENADVAAITAAMGSSVGLMEFKQKHPDRCFDVGIAEQHAVTFASGLATGGVKPFVLIYSTFLQRSYDQILHDVAISSLPVTFLLDRAGFIGADGKTHQGLQDLSYLTSIPNVTVWTPCSASQLTKMIEHAGAFTSPLAIRYPRSMPTEFDLDFVPNKWNVVRNGSGKVRLLAAGPRLLRECLKAVGDAEVEVVAVTSVKPLDEDYLASIRQGDVIVTLEENQLVGGFGSAVNAYLKSAGCKITNLGVSDKFVPHGSVAEQLAWCKLDSSSIARLLENLS